jgi:Protein of unknown function (DUF3341)/Cytochrome C oxidase, cbb3-type, subunit III
MTADPRPALMAAFARPEALSAAAEDLAGTGIENMDAFTPFPVHGLARTLGMRPSRLPQVMLAGGIAGAVGVYALILYSVAVDYPINVGGRGLNAWPAYLVLSFEAGILGAALAGFFGLLHANRLPEYHHPVFDVPHFGFAQGGDFWLLVPVPDDAAKWRLRERFDIFCSPCHGLGGEGDGMIVQRGFPAPPSFHDSALLSAPDRRFYDVITEGYGVMYPLRLASAAG